MVKKSILAAMLCVSLSAFGATQVEVWRSPDCGCCGAWISHLKTEGFDVVDHQVDDMASIKQSLGVPPGMESCHTALVEGYAIEGHVPAAAIRKLLREKPVTKGLSAPGMPSNAPGMGRMNGQLETLTFDNQVFSRN